MTEKTMLERVRSKDRTNEQILEELRLLNEKKAQQLDNDKLFREMWEQLKRNDRHTAYVMVFIAILAFSLEIVQLEDFYIIQHRLAQLLEPLTHFIGG